MLAGTDVNCSLKHVAGTRFRKVSSAHCLAKQRQAVPRHQGFQDQHCLTKQTLLNLLQIALNKPSWRACPHCHLPHAEKAQVQVGFYLIHTFSRHGSKQVFPSLTPFPGKNISLVLSWSKCPSGENTNCCLLWFSAKEELSQGESSRTGGSVEKPLRVCFLPVQEQRVAALIFSILHWKAASSPGLTGSHSNA